MSDRGFSVLSNLAYREAGLVLSEAKSAMIKSRLRHRLKALEVNDLEEYCEYVESTKGQHEKKHMISALTTNVSSFFREPHHFDLVTKVISEIQKQRSSSGKFLIWSAGCSNGQEAYSLALHLMNLENNNVRDFHILATDIDEEVLNFARNGVYDYNQVEGVGQEMLAKFFSPADGSRGLDCYKICREVAEHVTFKRLNIVGDWPMKQKYDIIFCRNVVIYFDAVTQEKLWPKFFDLLKPGGMICVGHSERVVCPGLVTIGPTAYQKPIVEMGQNCSNTERTS